MIHFFTEKKFVTFLLFILNCWEMWVLGKFKDFLCFVILKNPPDKKLPFRFIKWRGWSKGVLRAFTLCELLQLKKDCFIKIAKKEIIRMSKESLFFLKISCKSHEICFIFTGKKNHRLPQTERICRKRDDNS